ncbi:SIS domain-containing protein [uncultured Sunxiuqinia sp.]|uniref:SIS domain-containing protein n=1 Tax=uncultured Sunxiuqinia sp. TaxID=1573825 RepID=UPI002AA91A01|nr:SIS domain-containing protein [uncultured Sunxiuqinia sp.]
MSYLNYSTEELNSNGGIHTAREICSQPEMWEQTYSKFQKERSEIITFLDKVFAHQTLRVILTGAGSSAFIGEALEGVYIKKMQVNCQAIGTTDLITHPDHYFISSEPTLLISFARSGNSPESTAAVELARTHCNNLYELNITCNKDGELAQKANNENSYTFLLPERTNDLSLAMTSSFSSMLLTGLLLLYVHELDSLAPVIGTIQELANSILSEGLQTLKEIAKHDCKRMVFLGSGPLLGIAHESHLKVQELTDGQIICKFDSFLGFRHGPKAIVNESTIIVYLISNNSYSNLYERDLINSVEETKAKEVSVAIGNIFSEKKSDFDYSVQFTKAANTLPEEFLTVFYILPAQIIGFYKSLNLGLSPDSPSKSNAISRVVKGVNIYQMEK